MKNISRLDLAWGYFAQFLNIGSGVLLIPIAISTLTTEDLAFWYIFVALAGLAQLLEFGFQPTISRLVTYVYSGAVEVRPTGIPKKGNGLSIQTLYDLIAASKKIYMFVGISTSIVLILFGTLYLETFEYFGTQQMIAWLLFALGTVINFYFSYFNGLLRGRGDQVVVYRILAYSKLIMICVSIPLLFLGFNLLSMAIGNLVSLLYSRVYLYKRFYDVNIVETKQLYAVNSVIKDYSLTVWRSAWKLGLTSLGAFLVLRSNMFIVSTYIGLEQTASYALTGQLIAILSTVSGMYFTLSLPKLNSLQSVGDKVSIKLIMSRSYITSCLIFFIGSLVIYFLGYDILNLISSNTSLVLPPILLVMLVASFLELWHSQSATYLTTKNQVPFASASLISGLSICLLGFLSANYTESGVLGLVLIQCLVQLSYNNWYWHVQVYSDVYKK